MISLSRLVRMWMILSMVAAGFLASALITWQRRRRPQTRLWQGLLWLMLAIYAAAYLYLTIFLREPADNSQTALTPFWSYRSAFVWENGFRVRRRALARQILLNILLYIPLGCMLPVLLERHRHRLALSLAIGLGLSVLTEALQYIAHVGLCEFDDVFNNFLGCLIGVLAIGAVQCLLDRAGRRGSSRPGRDDEREYDDEDRMRAGDQEQ